MTDYMVDLNTLDKDGEVECLKGESVIRILKKGDNVGQKALLEGDVRSLDVRAKTDCKIYSISSEFFKTCKTFLRFHSFFVKCFIVIHMIKICISARRSDAGNSHIRCTFPQNYSKCNCK